MTPPFNVLDPQQNIYGNFFLEASAGTGKTFTIAHLVVRLICESQPPIDISKIGVVTFTKAAALELKIRIKDLITTLKDNLEQNQTSQFYNESVDKQEILYRLKLALINFDSAPITTIHGFCFQILKKYATHLNICPQIQSQDDVSVDALCYDHIKNVLKSESSTQSLCKEQKEQLLSSKRGDLHSLILSLKQYVLSGIDIEPLPTWPELEQQILASCSAILPDLQDILHYVDRFKCSPLTKEDVQKQIETFHEVYQSKTNLEKLLFKKPFWDYLNSNRLKVKANQNYSTKVEQFFLEFQQSTAPILKRAIQPAFCELLIGNICKNSFDQLLVQLGILSFSSMLKNLDNTLTSETSVFIRQDFDAMIVDEFQDTDPIQWSILQKLFIKQPVKAFYMVGDPKQAIYAFRSADVYTYMNAKNQCPNLHLGTLSTCFRSAPNFIEALNVFLSKTTWLKLPFLEISYPYQAVLSSDKTNQGISSPFTFYAPKSSVEETEKLTSDLAILLNQQHPNDTVAILVKDRFQLDRIQNLLQSSGASFQSIKNESLDGSIVFSLLEELLLFLDLPCSKQSLNRFMLSDWFNFDLFDFEKDKQDTIKAAAFSFHEKLKAHFCLNGLLSCLEKILDSYWPETNDIFRSLLSSVYGEDIIDKLFDVGALLHKRSESIYSAQILRLHLHQLKKENIQIQQLQQPHHRIYVLTSHMSKGLEYDHVICLGIATRHEKTPDIILKRIHNTSYLGLNLKDPLSMKALCDLDMEKLRQMYVAITRAKKTVHLPQITYELDNVAYTMLSPLEFYVLLIKNPQASYEQLYLGVPSLNLAKDTTDIFSDSVFSHVDDVPCIGSQKCSIFVPYLDKDIPFCDLISEHSISFSSLKTESEFEKTDDPLKGKDFGDFFHMLMDQLLSSGNYRHFYDSKIQTFYSKLIKLSPFKDHEDVILNYIFSCLELHFTVDNQEGFQLKNIDPKDLYVETSFRYMTEAGLMKGVIDCAVVYQNQLFFIDWKTSFLNNTNYDHLEQHMKKASYDLQLDIYKNALVLQKNYFKGIPLKKAFYVFVKHSVFYQKDFEENPCLA